jgi:hypothetical protein
MKVFQGFFQGDISLFLRIILKRRHLIILITIIYITLSKIENDIDITDITLEKSLKYINTYLPAIKNKK